MVERLDSSIQRKEGALKVAYQNYPVNECENLASLVLQSASAFGQRTAFCEKRDGVTVTYSYARLGTDVFSLVAALSARGLVGARILIAGQNCYHFVLSFLAVTAAGCCAIPVDHAADAEAFEALAKRTGAQAAILSPDFIPKSDRLPSSVRRFSFADLDDLIAEGDALSVDPSVLRLPEPDLVAAVFFTADACRGVMLSHRNLCFDAAAVCKMVEVRPDDVFLSVLPIHHAYEMTCGILVPLLSGAKIAFSEGLRYLTREMKEYHPTVLNCVPYLAEVMYQKVMAGIRRQGLEGHVKNMIRVTSAILPEKAALAAKRRAFSFIHKSFGGHLRLILTTGAPADPTVMRGFRKFGILAIQSYSIVECSPVAAINRDRFYRATSAGLPMPETVLDIYDMNEEGLGEIRVKGKNIMLGYFDDAETTKAVLKNGWFYTGDLGFFDPDGFLRVIGRKKNLVITASGKRIYPEEIEALLNENKLIAESLVRIVPDRSAEGVHVEATIHPDRVAVAALRDDNPKQRAAVEIRAAVDELNRILPPTKRIKRFTVSASPLPRTPSGRLVR